MTKKINLKLFFILVLAGAVTGLMVLPFTFALIELPPEVPMALVVVAQTVQQTLLLAFSCFLGLWLVQKTELKGLGITECLLRREKPNVHFKKLAAQAVLWGLLGGACTVVLCIPFWDVSVKLLQDEMRVALWKSVLACFYGGVGEEILFRLGMMTFFVWLLQKCKLKKAAYWTAIILTGILFGLGHMGITGSLTAVTPAVILRAVLLNGSLSVLYGILYWKRGLESAMLAHFSTDVVLHILIPHLIAPLFM